MFWLKSVVDKFAGDSELFDLVWMKVLLEKGFFFLNLGELVVDVASKEYEQTVAVRQVSATHLMQNSLNCFLIAARLPIAACEAGAVEL